MKPAALLRHMKAGALALVRRGPREVILSGAALRGGNHLYQWMLASILRRANPETFVLHVDNQESWLEEFPALQALSLPAGDLRLRDKRLLRLGQGFGSDFFRDDLTQFCTDYLLSSPSFLSRLASVAYLDDGSTVTVNVRRGDYYGTHFEPDFGMRIVPYVRTALEKQREIRAIDRLQFVSDDLPWCAEAFADLADEVKVSFVRPGTGPFDDLAALAASQRLILANSTFSYWGAYLASVRGTDPADIVAPRFHERYFGDALPWFHDPEWTLVQSIPGGWNSITA